MDERVDEALVSVDGGQVERRVALETEQMHHKLLPAAFKVSVPRGQRSVWTSGLTGRGRGRKGAERIVQAREGQTPSFPENPSPRGPGGALMSTTDRSNQTWIWRAVVAVNLFPATPRRTLHLTVLITAPLV